MRSVINILSFKTFIFTSLSLIAFAANSVLCRLALGEQSIDPASFTFVRLLSAILMLLVLISVAKYAKRNNTLLVKQKSKGSWSASLLLFIYALCFSFAYVSLDTGSGALILFAAVQITMILKTIINGNKLHWAEWLGLGMAFTGFIYLVLPTVSTPSLYGFMLMTLAGIAWGIYTLNGRNSANALADTYYNFLRTAPLLLLLLLLNINQGYVTEVGVIYAVLSGAIASGLGYSLWYAALTGLGTTQAAVVQLLVPVIASLGGIVWVGENIEQRFIISSMMILGGILLVLLASYKPKIVK